jgi:hypothetical protein
MTTPEDELASPRDDPKAEMLVDCFAEILDCLLNIQGALRHNQRPQDYHFHKALAACRDGTALARRGEANP